MCFVASSPAALRVAQAVLHVVQRRLVAGVLADIVTDLYGMVAPSRFQLDHNIERDGLVPGGRVDEVIWTGQQKSWMQSDILVRNVPMPKDDAKPSFSATALYFRHFPTFSESENTIVFLSVIFCSS